MNVHRRFKLYPMLWSVLIAYACTAPSQSQKHPHAVKSNARHANAALDAALIAAIDGTASLTRIRSLLDRGADPNADSDTETGHALHYAAYQGRTDIVKLLLARHADVNKININDDTPLTIAAIHGDVDMARALIAHGARLEQPHGHTALMSAAAAVNIPTFRYLLTRPGANIKAETKAGGTALSAACERNANLSRLPQDDPQYEQKRIAFVRYLMRQGARVNNRFGQCPALHDALWSGGLARLLLDAHANVNSSDNLGGTVLHHAASGDDVDEACLPLLLKAGAKVNVRDQQGQTPLMWAAGAGNASGVKRLLAAGANRSFKDKQGRTALDLARSEKHSDVVALLIANPMP